MKKFTMIRFTVSVFTLLFLSATIVFFMTSSDKLFMKHSEFSLKMIAQEKSASIDTEIKYAEGSIRLLSHFVSSQMTERELKNPNAVFEKYTETLPFDFVEYIRWDGLNFMNSVEGSEPFDASDRQYYKEGIKGNTGIWTNFKPKVSKEVLLNFYTPVYYQGEISGVITGAMGETSSLKPKFIANYFGHQIASFVCDENYVVVSSVCEGIRPELDLKKHTDIKMIADIIQYAEERNLEPFLYEINGRNGLCCTSTVKSNGWHVVVIVYPSVLKAVERETSGNLFVISIVIMVILFLYLGVSLWLQAKSNRIVQDGLVFAATRDELTGLLNRRAYENELKAVEAAGLDENFTYVAFDVNGLKSANDNFGHDAGDELIKAAAKCIETCFGRYGKVYRTGGDEFIAIINAGEHEIANIQAEFGKETAGWKGQYTSGLKIPAGIVSKKEMPEASLHELSKIADQRMYKEKSLIYIASGIDRRAQNAAYEVLCTSYTKILKVNLTNDDFSIIQMDANEKAAIKGYSDKFSEWLNGFGTSGQIYEEDIENYLYKTSLEYMRSFFKSGNKELNIQYRRKIGEEYRRVLMEMKPAKDYSDNDQIIFLYVKNIDK
ncbi:MAG: diguanylate cyclase [Treponemataceae bacterium]|nr:diguanylate cyclase [Treponemataceae bacterium]